MAETLAITRWRRITSGIRLIIKDRYLLSVRLFHLQSFALLGQQAAPHGRDILFCQAPFLSQHREDEPETDSYQLLFGMLTENQSTLLRAIACERTVTAVNSVSFIKKYGLKGSSSINTALKYLIKKEYVFRSDKGYQVYDRFMELWLQTLPYSGQ